MNRIFVRMLGFCMTVLGTTNITNAPAATASRCETDQDCVSDDFCISGYCCAKELAEENRCTGNGGGGTCTGCKNCTNVGWEEYGDGNQIYITKICTCNMCNSTVSYRCTSGYYGWGPSGSLVTCNPCPNNGISIPDTTSATGCYLPGGTTETTSAGTLVYTSDCYYVG